MSVMKAPPNQAPHVFVTAAQMGQPVRTAQQETSSGLLAGAAPTLPAWASLPHAAHTRRQYSFLWGVSESKLAKSDFRAPAVTALSPGVQPPHGCPARRVAGWLPGPAGLSVLLPSLLCPPASCPGLGAVSSGPNGREFLGRGWDHRRWQEVWFLKEMRSWFAGRRVGEPAFGLTSIWGACLGPPHVP